MKPVHQDAFDHPSPTSREFLTHPNTVKYLFAELARAGELVKVPGKLLDAAVRKRGY